MLMLFFESGFWRNSTRKSLALQNKHQEKKRKWPIKDAKEYIFVNENYTRNLRSICLKNIEEDLTKYTSTNGNLTL